MDLTVVIVNYNVEHFLEQCLLSVEEACKTVQAEVYVVDNNSVDGSCAMVKEKFPWVKLIENKENVGFSKANNQAMRISEGRFVLLLNPDTVVEEDTLSKTVAFMDAHPDAGGLGVRMVDGKGRFLPESKRGLPTPWVAFCKISGVYRIFKRSKRFNHYYMGYLSEMAVNPVEILSGAFMLMRRETLLKVGLLDEAFFMYGEDIDLSWRIIAGGYKNYYFPETTIIHYKGESTKKGSLNYVFVFYQAMVIFANKHFSEKNARLFSSLINMAIYARAGLAIMSRFLKALWLPLMDAALLVGGMWAISRYYAEWQDKIYETGLLLWAFTAFAVVWMTSVFFSGGYDRPLSVLRMLRGALMGSLIVLVGYSLLPEELRFSRALVLFGALFALLYYPLSRTVLSVLAPARFAWVTNRERRYVVVAQDEEHNRISELIRQTQGGDPEVIRAPIVEGEITGNWGETLHEVIRIYKADVVIFSGRDLSSATIIDLMGQTADAGVDYKIAPPDSLYMIGSNSIDTSGDLFMLQTNGIHKNSNRRNKRLLDVFMASALLLLGPLLIWFMNQKGGFVRNLFAVLAGQRSWVGYDCRFELVSGLPRIAPGVLHPAIGLPAGYANEDTSNRLNVIYARDYRVKNDLMLIVRNMRSLGDQRNCD